MDRDKALTIFAIILVSFYLLPNRRIELPGGLLSIYTPLALYYIITMLLSLYYLRHLPFIWNIVSSICFTLISMDYWELPFPWLTPLEMGRTYFTIRWRIFPVISPMLIMFILFSYKWSFWKYNALALPGFLAKFLYPFILFISRNYVDTYVPIIGLVDFGTFGYMPNRIISTLAIGWVLLNGTPSRFLKRLIVKPNPPKPT